MAGIYNGHLLEFPQIRVDCFTSPRPNEPYQLPHLPSASSSPGTSSSSPIGTYAAPTAQMNLLTHVHSDHLLGLSNSFTGRIVCSPDTKRMLLRLEAEKERGFMVDGTREVIRRKYDKLAPRREKVGEGKRERERVVDQIEAVPFDDPRQYDLGCDEAGKTIIVTITLLDANHCPGSTMFLITSPTKAVLHTGDIRADKLFMRTLMRNPAIQQFIAPTSSFSAPGPSTRVKVEEDPKGKGKALESGPEQVRKGSGRRVLDRIYLDTSAFLGTGDMPDKEEALQDLLQQMSLYPPDTVFFLNVWCFGWEDVVKEVARHFDTQVHVDRYKNSIYSAVRSDPFLSACTTTDPSATRFHACERWAKCEACRTFNAQGDRVWNKGKRVVHVNMVEVKSASWVLEREAFVRTLTSAAIGEGDWPFNIQCPIARHSPLPELQALVRLFRPNNISPNTLVPQTKGLDYFLLPSLLADHVGEGTYDRMILERDTYFSSKPQFGSAWLSEMRQLQAAGVDLARELLVEMGGSERDDYLPGLDGMGVGQGGPLGGGGGTRSAHTTDQLWRAGGIGGGMSAAIGGQAGRGWDGDMDGYSTDEENRGRNKRRRMRESSPTSESQDVEMLAEVKVEEEDRGVGTKVEVVAVPAKMAELPAARKEVKKVEAKKEPPTRTAPVVLQMATVPKKAEPAAVSRQEVSKVEVKKESPTRRAPAVSRPSVSLSAATSRAILPRSIPNYPSHTSQLSPITKLPKLDIKVERGTQLNGHSVTCVKPSGQVANVKVEQESQPNGRPTSAAETTPTSVASRTATPPVVTARVKVETIDPDRRGRKSAPPLAPKYAVNAPHIQALLAAKAERDGA